MANTVLTAGLTLLLTAVPRAANTLETAVHAHSSRAVANNTQPSSGKYEQNPAFWEIYKEAYPITLGRTAEILDRKKVLAQKLAEIYGFPCQKIDFDSNAKYGFTMSVVGGIIGIAYSMDLNGVNYKVDVIVQPSKATETRKGSDGSIQRTDFAPPIRTR